MAYAASKAPKSGAEDKDEEGEGYPLETLVQMFEEAEEATFQARKLAERDRDYYDHKQLTAEERAALKERNQPDIIINRIQPKIDFLLGHEAELRTDPKAFPRTPADEEAAGAATDALRYVGDENELAQKFSQGWEHLLIEGVEAFELTVDPELGNDVVVVEWAWDRVFWDPFSRKPDFSDATYLGGITWMDERQAKDQWPGKEDAIDASIADAAANSTTYADRPWKVWVSGRTRKRVRVVQMYYKQGKSWHQCVFTKGGKLESLEVPFRDHRNQAWCPMILQSAYVDRENNRYGLVRQMIGPQDEVNKRRAKALHHLTAKRYKYEDGAIDDPDMARKELARPDGMVKINPGFVFEELDNHADFKGHLELLQEAKNEIDLLGPNKALTGDANSPSGRALLANKQSGQTEISRTMDRHFYCKKRVYQGIWNLVRQYKTEEWWVRVTDDEKKVRFVGFNRPVTMAEELAKKLAGDLEAQGITPDQIEGQVQAQLAQLQADPMQAMQLQQVVRMENVPADMNMDITVEQVPDTANVQEEQFQALVQLAPAVVFPPAVYIKASGLRNKDELLKELEGANNPEVQAIQQKQIEQAVAKEDTEIGLKQAQIEKTLAEAEKIKAETAISGAEAVASIDATQAAAEHARAQVGHTQAQTEATLNPPVDPNRANGGAPPPG